MALGNALVAAGLIVHAKNPRLPFKPKPTSLYRFTPAAGAVATAAADHDGNAPVPNEPPTTSNASGHHLNLTADSLGTEPLVPVPGARYGAPGGVSSAGPAAAAESAATAPPASGLPSGVPQTSPAKKLLSAPSEVPANDNTQNQNNVTKRMRLDPSGMVSVDAHDTADIAGSGGAGDDLDGGDHAKVGRWPSKRPPGAAHSSIAEGEQVQAPDPHTEADEAAYFRQPSRQNAAMSPSSVQPSGAGAHVRAERIQHQRFGSGSTGRTGRSGGVVLVDVDGSLTQQLMEERAEERARRRRLVQRHGQLDYISRASEVAVEGASPPYASPSGMQLHVAMGQRSIPGPPYYASPVPTYNLDSNYSNNYGSSTTANNNYYDSSNSDDNRYRYQHQGRYQRPEQQLQGKGDEDDFKDSAASTRRPMLQSSYATTAAPAEGGVEASKPMHLQSNNARDSSSIDAYVGLATGESSASDGSTGSRSSRSTDGADGSVGAGADTDGNHVVVTEGTRVEGNKTRFAGGIGGDGDGATADLNTAPEWTATSSAFNNDSQGGAAAVSPMLMRLQSMLRSPLSRQAESTAQLNARVHVLEDRLSRAERTAVELAALLQEQLQGAVHSRANQLSSTPDTPALLHDQLRRYASISIDLLLHWYAAMFHFFCYRHPYVTVVATAALAVMAQWGGFHASGDVLIALVSVSMVVWGVMQACGHFGIALPWPKWMLQHQAVHHLFGSPHHHHLQLRTPVVEVTPAAGDHESDRASIAPASRGVMMPPAQQLDLDLEPAQAALINAACASGDAVACADAWEEVTTQQRHDL